MARKVFMSVIGNGLYSKCIYIKDEFVSTETRFVQQATLQMLNYSGEKWTENDCAYFLLTEEARKTNWQVDGNKRKKNDGNFEDYIGLYDYLKQDKFPFQIKDVGIEIGRNEEEIWKIFSVIYDCLQEGDELYIDLSYSFRYLPMLLIVLGNYAKFLKKVKVKSITYGYLDTKDNKPGLIIDVTSFSILQDWTFAGASFVEMGKVQNFTDTVWKSVVKLNSKDTKTRNNVMCLNCKLKSFEGQILTCRGGQLVEGKEISDAKKLIDIILTQSCLPAPLAKILCTIGNELTCFTEKTFDNLRYALNWCKRYGYVQQGYTLCQESIITFLCERYKEYNPYLKGNDKKAYRKYRDYWGAILGIKNPKCEAEWKGAIADFRPLTKAFFKLEWLSDFRKKYNKLQENRNQVNHAGFVGNVSSENIIKNFEVCVDECVSIFNQDLDNPVVHENTSSVFINLSNHPSEKWGDEQRRAAEAIGTIIDMPFPAVEPEATAEAINKEAERLVAEIMKYAVDNMVTVHVMGEMSLTYAVVSKLSAYGVRCVCSTTNRVVCEEGDGKRMVEFHFKQFREYA